MIAIYHNKDLDGWCSGAIIRAKHRNAQMIGYDYGEPFTFPFEEEVIMADVSLKMDDMFTLAELNDCNFTWIDHHISAINEYKQWMERLGFREMNPIEAVLDPAKSACELTWNYLFADREMPETVRLLGEYDTWRNQDQAHWNQRVLPFQFGMRLICNSLDTFPMYMLMDNDEMVGEIIEKGKTVLEYQKNFNESQCRNAFETELFGLRAICLNAGGFNSDLFKSIYDPQKHDIMVPFQWNGNTWSVSLYTTHDLIDCSALAKGMGGGGHRKAAGFKTDDINFLIKK